MKRMVIKNREKRKGNYANGKKDRINRWKGGGEGKGGRKGVRSGGRGVMEGAAGGGVGD